jgi:hypothetical protein
MLAAALTSASAQDTLYFKDVQQIGNYFFQPPIPGENEQYYCAFHSLGPNACEGGKHFYTKDSLIIYGIAAAINVSPFDFELPPEECYYDTGDTYTYEYLRLYKPTPDSLICQRSVKVHPGHTPVAYYINLDRWHYTPVERFITPVYELYFRPQKVVDSFYVGMTNWGGMPYTDSTGRVWPQRNRHLRIFDFGMVSVSYAEKWIYCLLYPAPRTWLHLVSPQSFTYLFPILTPKPDTTATGDTLGATDAGLVERFTGVIPNPAAEKARVVSSFGISLVEVYIPGGALVLSQRADGLHVDLDVGRWPAGTYLVRIHTPQGVAVKKLVVRR